MPRSPSRRQALQAIGATFGLAALDAKAALASGDKEESFDSTAFHDSFPTQIPGIETIEHLEVKSAKQILIVMRQIHASDNPNIKTPRWIGNSINACQAQLYFAIRHLYHHPQVRLRHLAPEGLLRHHEEQQIRNLDENTRHFLSQALGCPNLTDSQVDQQFRLFETSSGRCSALQVPVEDNTSTLAFAGADHAAAKNLGLELHAPGQQVTERQGSNAARSGNTERIEKYQMEMRETTALSNLSFVDERIIGLIFGYLHNFRNNFREWNETLPDLKMGGIILTPTEVPIFDARLKQEEKRRQAQGAR